MSIAPTTEPDVTFLRNVGLVLLAVAIASGSIGVIGTLNSTGLQKAVMDISTANPDLIGMVSARE